MKKSMDAKKRLMSSWGEPLFKANWEKAIFLHFNVDPSSLQNLVPFKLDLYKGDAFVSLVAFTMSNMQPNSMGKFGI